MVESSIVDRYAQADEVGLTITKSAESPLLLIVALRMSSRVLSPTWITTGPLMSIVPESRSVRPLLLQSYSPLSVTGPVSR